MTETRIPSYEQHQLIEGASQYHQPSGIFRLCLTHQGQWESSPKDNHYLHVLYWEASVRRDLHGKWRGVVVDNSPQWRPGETVTACVYKFDEADDAREWCMATIQKKAQELTQKESTS